MKDLLRKKWLFEVMNAADGKNGATFTAIKATCRGISNRVLTELLAALVGKKIFERQVKDDRTVTYCLSSKGKKVLKMLREIMRMS